MRTLALAIVVTAMASSSFTSHAEAQESVRRIVRNEILSLLPADGAGGIAVAVRIDDRVLFFDGGFADLAERRPVTPDSLFNVASLRKPFEATLLALAVQARQDGARPSRLDLPAGACRRRRYPPHHRGPARNPHVRAFAAARPSAVADDALHAGELPRNAQGLASRCCAPARPAASLHPRRLHPAAARARARPRRFHWRPGRAKDLRAPRHDFQLDSRPRQGRPERSAAAAPAARRSGLFRGRRRRHRPARRSADLLRLAGHRSDVQLSARSCRLPRRQHGPTAASRRRSPEPWPWHKLRHSRSARTAPRRWPGRSTTPPRQPSSTRTVGSTTRLPIWA